MIFFKFAVFMMSLIHAFNNTKMFDYMHQEEVCELAGAFSVKCILTAYNERSRAEK